MLKLLIITEEKQMARTVIHPGEHLADELKELNMSAAELARQIDVPVNRVTGIINSAQRYRRHSIAAWPLVRNQPRLLAQSSNALRATFSAAGDWQAGGKAPSPGQPQAQGRPCIWHDVNCSLLDRKYWNSQTNEALQSFDDPGQAHQRRGSQRRFLRHRTLDNGC